jgi:quercetin dioxygenase-like cupin family protein
MISLATPEVLSEAEPPCVALPPRLDWVEQTTSIPEDVKFLADHPPIIAPVKHLFQEGVYLREIFMPKDGVLVGHEHKFAHYNIIISGKALVWMDEGEVKEVKAGDVIYSEAGVRKRLLIVEDMRWITVHSNPTDSHDVAWLEENIVNLDEVLLMAKGNRTLDELRLSECKQLT